MYPHNNDKRDMVLTLYRLVVLTPGWGKSKQREKGGGRVRLYEALCLAGKQTLLLFKHFIFIFLYD